MRLHFFMILAELFDLFSKAIEEMFRVLLLVLLEIFDYLILLNKKLVSLVLVKDVF